MSKPSQPPYPRPPAPPRARFGLSAAPSPGLPAWMASRRVTRVGHGARPGPGAHAGYGPNATPSTGSAIREALAARLQRVARQLALELPEQEADVAVRASNDYLALETALKHAPIVQDTLDPVLAAAYARGLVARQELLRAEGGVVSGEQLGNLLGGITRQAVDKRRRAGRLLALRERSDWVYPVWQVAENRMLPGFEDVLAELTARGHGPWDAMLFFLETDTQHDGETPLAALRGGGVERALWAARTYGEQGAR